MMFPDLRYSQALKSPEAFHSIVIEGALQAAGMASFKGVLSDPEAQEVRAYLIARANQAKAQESASKAPPPPVP